MSDILGALVVALVGAGGAVGGFLILRNGIKKVRGSRTWARTEASITKAWRENVGGGEPGSTRYHVNYAFTAAETGGSYYGHSNGGDPGMEAGDTIQVMYDPKAPYNNELPLNRFEIWFYPIFFGTLTAFAAVVSVVGLVAAIVMTLDRISA